MTREEVGMKAEGSTPSSVGILKDWVQLVRGVRCDVASDITRMHALLVSLPARPQAPAHSSPQKQAAAAAVAAPPHCPPSSSSLLQRHGADAEAEGARGSGWTEDLAYAKPAFEPAKRAGPSAARVQSVYGAPPTAKKVRRHRLNPTPQNPQSCTQILPRRVPILSSPWSSCRPGGGEWREGRAHKWPMWG